MLTYTLNLSDGSTASMVIVDPNTTIDLELAKMNHQLTVPASADSLELVSVNIVGVQLGNT